MVARKTGGIITADLSDFLERAAASGFSDKEAAAWLRQQRAPMIEVVEAGMA